MRLRPVFLLGAAGALFGAAPAHAQRAKSACGITTLPLAEGNSWTYDPIPLSTGAPAPLEGPPQGSITVKVASVTDKQGKSEIVLEETYRGVTRKTTSTCTAAGMVMSPESFLFAGEPGATVLITFSNVEYKDGPSYPAHFGPGGTEWYEEIHGDAARGSSPGTTVQHPPARIEIERALKVAGNEAIETGVGVFTAVKVTFELRGRAILGESKAEIPAKKDPGELYFAPNVGLVHLKDITGQEWKLSDTNLTVRNN